MSKNIPTVQDRQYQRVSTIAIERMILYLKQRKHKIYGYAEVGGKTWHIQIENALIYFLGNKQAYDYLMPIYKTEQQKEYAEYIKKRMKRESEKK